MLKRVVITGLGVVAPGANSVSEFSRLLREGCSAITHQPDMAEAGFNSQVAGSPTGYMENLEQYFTSEELLAVNDLMVLTSRAAIDAWKDAGLEVPDRKSDHVHWDTGAILGTHLGALDTVNTKLLPNVQAGKIRRIGSSAVEQIMLSSLSAKVGGLLALGNQVSTNSSACTTSSEAIIMSYLRIRHGLASRMVAGGAEGRNIFNWAGFDAMRVLSSKFNETPEKASRPLSASAGGFVPGAGAGVVILEDLETAQKRGAKIYAEIIGTALNGGGHRMGGSMTAPNPISVQRAITDAVKAAGIKAADIDYINGHLTGTFADPYEIANWSTALQIEPSELPLVNATKSVIGHTLAAAGSIETVGLLTQMNEGFLHASLNAEDLHEKILPYEKSIVRQKRDASIRIAAKSSFGFGDVNGVMIFRKFEKQE